DLHLSGCGGEHLGCHSSYCQHGCGRDSSRRVGWRESAGAWFIATDELLAGAGIQHLSASSVSVESYFDSSCAFRMASRIACPFGDPNPVQASQPCLVEYAPFVPVAMSFSALCCITVPYSSGFRKPARYPSSSFISAVSPAHNGADALVPPATPAVPPTIT